MRDESPITSSSSATNGRINELQLWAVREGLRRAPAAPLFEDFCRRLIGFGVPLWRAFAGMRTLHPQWAGYTYTWRRDHDAVHPGRDRRVAAEALRPPVRRHQAVLQTVGGVVGVAHRAQGDRPEAVAMPGEQGGERVGVTGDVCGQEVGVRAVVRRAVSHP